MSIKCTNCFRPMQNCFCKQIREFDPGIKFIFLMHPVEAYKQKTGTGRLASLTLKNSEIIIGTDFESNKRFTQLINDKNNLCFILYPDRESQQIRDLHNRLDLSKKIVVFLIDATWSHAGKIYKRNPSIQKLNKISFSKKYLSDFKIKRQPKTFCLSTIESCYYLIEEFKDIGICQKNLKSFALIDIFNSMVNYQIQSHQKRLKCKNE